MGECNQSEGNKSKANHNYIKALECLEKLKGLYPKAPSTNASILEVLSLNGSEEAYSDFLHWFLGTKGPMKGHLLQIISEKIKMPTDSIPTRIKREFDFENLGTDRVDLLIAWTDGRRLAIENKYNSSETNKNQCERYLSHLGKKDKLLYLTRTGKDPGSVTGDNPRLETMSYPKLAELVDEAITRLDLDDERGRVLGSDFSRALRVAGGVLVKGNEDDELVLSTSTIRIIGMWKRFEGLREQAKRESDLIIQRAVQRIRSRLAETEDIEVDLLPKGWLFRRESWSLDNSMSCGVAVEGGRGHVIHEWNPRIGVRIEGGKKKIRKQLHRWVREQCPPSMPLREAKERNSVWSCSERATVLCEHEAWASSLTERQGWWEKMEGQPSEDVIGEWMTPFLTSVVNVWSEYEPILDTLAEREPH